MTEIRRYLIRIVFCAFLVSLTGTFASDERSKRALRLAGGCVMILAVLRPLTGLELSKWRDLLPELPEWRAEAMEEAEKKNRQLLTELIASQTEEHIEKAAADLGIRLQAAVTVRETEPGVFVPWSVELKGSCTAEQRQTLAQTLERELAIPPERQIWRQE